MASVSNSPHAGTAASDHLRSGMRLRVGTWNLERGEPRWQRAHQAAHMSNEADLWLLTAACSQLQIGNHKPAFSGSRPGEHDQHWAAISSTWPMKPVPTAHPSLVMARISHPEGTFLAASSVFPWRTAAELWPNGDGDSFAERCAQTLAKHTREIMKASLGLPVVWGGDFNQALSGPELVGSDVGRGALLEAFVRLGLRVVTVEANGQDPHRRSIDHIAIPSAWGSRLVSVQRPQSDARFLSDHPSYVVSVDRTSEKGRPPLPLGLVTSSNS